MYTFPELIKKIRNEAGLTQEKFAKILGVSPVLIAMVESGQKEVSKKLVLRLAKKLSVHPSSITPFIFVDKPMGKKMTDIERSLIRLGEKIQTLLIEKRAKHLAKYAR